MAKSSKQKSESQHLEFVNPLFDADSEQRAEDDGDEDDEADVDRIRVNGRGVFKDIGMREYEELEPQQSGLCHPRNRLCVIPTVVIVVAAVIGACVIITVWRDFEVPGSGAAMSEAQSEHNQVTLHLNVLRDKDISVSTMQHDMEQALRTIGKGAENVGQHLAYMEVSVFGNLSVCGIYQFDKMFANLAYYLEVSFYDETTYLDDGNIGMGDYIVDKDSIKFSAQHVNISATPASDASSAGHQKHAGALSS